MAFSRRDFLLRTTGFVTVSAMVPRWAVAGASRFEESVAAADTGRTLVVLELMGGNDGLNTVVPYADALYPQLRSRIGIPTGSVPSARRATGPEPGHDRPEVALGREPGGGRDERRISELEPLALRVARHLAHGRSAARAAARVARPLGRRDARGQRQSALLRGDLAVAAADAARGPRGRADVPDPGELPVPDRRGLSRRTAATRSRRFSPRAEPSTRSGAPRGVARGVGPGRDLLFEYPADGRQPDTSRWAPIRPSASAAGSS